MKKAKRKLITGAICLGCALLAVGGIVAVSSRMDGGAIPVSLSSYENEKPIIVLDAGHG